MHFLWFVFLVDLFFQKGLHLAYLLLYYCRTDLVFLCYFAWNIPPGYQLLHPVETAQLFNILTSDLCIFPCEGGHQAEDMFVFVFFLLIFLLLMIDGESLYIAGPEIVAMGVHV